MTQPALVPGCAWLALFQPTLSMCQAFIYLKLSTVYIPFLHSTCCDFKPKQILERVKGREGVVGKGRWRVK